MLALFGAVLAPATPAAGVYKWTDADGRTHFGDRPPEEVVAQEIKIQTFDGPAEVSNAGGTALDRSVTLLSAT